MEYGRRHGLACGLSSGLGHDFWYGLAIDVSEQSPSRCFTGWAKLLGPDKRAS